MAINFPTKMDLIVDEFYAHKEPVLKRTKWTPIKYASMKAFYFLNYSILILFIILIGCIASLAW